MQGHEREIKRIVGIVVINAAKVGIARKLATGRTVKTARKPATGENVMTAKKLRTEKNVNTARKLATNVMMIGKELRSVIVVMDGERQSTRNSGATGSGVRGAR